ncbi:MAG: hypothetical protein JO257_01895 [Deltaproteobacteria bacterium]|nr:hypothetical protein [Deltaproteobacteria bacterium]
MRQQERGSAMLVTMILVAALLAGAAVIAAMQMASTRGSDVTRTGMSAVYCAEAGLSAARPVVASNYASWAGTFYTSGTPTEPTWLSTGIGSHDLDGDGNADFMVYIKDNDDEIGTNNPAVDNDLRIFIVSRCIKYGETIKEVEELVTYSGGGTCYHSQSGNCFGNNNAN